MGFGRHVVPGTPKAVPPRKGSGGRGEEASDGRIGDVACASHGRGTGVGGPEGSGVAAKTESGSTRTHGRQGRVFGP
ncbi:hypothetical protein GCM10023238_35800 [Streptomyces heliomycini]